MASFKVKTMVTVISRSHRSIVIVITYVHESERGRFLGKFVELLFISVVKERAPL